MPGAQDALDRPSLDDAVPPYITATRSAMRATTPRSCAIDSTPSPSWALRSATCRRICAWTVTSSAVVGSSAMSRSGSHSSAMAIMTRWRMPPES